MKEVPRRRKSRERNERAWRGCDTVAVGCHSNAVSFYYLWYGAIYKRQYTDKHVTLSKCMCMRASGASELRKFWHFHILKLLLFQYFVGTLKISHGLISLGGGGKRKPPPPPPVRHGQTLTLSKCMCMRTSGASELRKFWHFYILKLLFLSIFCLYKWHACRLTCTDKFPNIPTNTNIEQMYVYASKRA